MEHLIRYLITLGWALTGAISMGIGIAIAVGVYTLLTPNIDEMEEIKKGNIGVAIIIVALILGSTVVIAVSLK